MPAAWWAVWARRFGDGRAAVFAVHDATVECAWSFIAGPHRMMSSLLRTLALSLFLAPPTMAAVVIGRRICQQCGARVGTR